MYKNEEYFIEIYLKCNKNLNKVAEFFNVSRALAYRYAKKYNLTNGKKLKRHKVNIDYFKQIDTEEKAYWLGFIMADGCVYKGASPNSYVFQINLAIKDKAMLESFNKAIDSDYEIKEYDSILNNKKYKCVSLSVSNTEFCKNLMKHGIVERKSSCAQFPAINLKMYRHFIRGLFDGDGSISFYKRDNSIRTGFCIVGNLDILITIKEIFNNMSIKTNIYSTHSAIAKSLETGSRKEAKKIYEYFYDKATIYLKRKKDIFDKITQITSPSIEKSIDKSLA